MTIGLKVPTNTVRASCKFIGEHAGQCIPVVRGTKIANLYVDVLDFFSDKKKFQRTVMDGNF